MNPKLKELQEIDQMIANCLLQTHDPSAIDVELVIRRNEIYREIRED